MLRARDTTANRNTHNVDMVMRAVAIVLKPFLDAITQSAEIDYN